jgi:hypothetical protein
MAELKYLGMTVTNENMIQEGIRRRLDWSPEPFIFLSAI